MYEFTLSTPPSLVAAVSEQQTSGGKYLAGGQTLVPTLRMRLADPGHLISLSRIAELHGITESSGWVTIGAAVTHAELARSERLRQSLPILAEVAAAIGDPAVRNRGTIGGSVANNDPSADYPAVLLALAATVVTNRREVAAADFFQGVFATSLTEDGDESELVTAIRLPFTRRAAYAKFRHPASGFALIGVAVAEASDGLRVAVTGGGFGVQRLESLESALTENFTPQALAGLRLDAADFASDSTTQADYRAALTVAMAQSAVTRILQDR